MPKERLLTIEEAAEFFQTSPSTVRRLVKHGLPFVRLIKQLRFRQYDLEQWVAANVRRGTAQSINLSIIDKTKVPSAYMTDSTTMLRPRAPRTAARR